MKILTFFSFMALAAANPLASSVSLSTPAATPASNATAESTSTATPAVLKAASSNDISCGPGNGVWVPGDSYYSLVDEFCQSAEGTDISDGYSQSDTYLTTLSPQGKQTTGDAGKVIFAIKNDGETPAYHVVYWVDDCATQLRALLDEDCYGKKGDTKGGTNKVGSITFEATVKKGNTWS